MKLTNKTNIDGRALRHFITAGLRAEGMDPARYSVRVRWRRAGARYRGWGGVGYRWIELLPARPPAGIDFVSQAETRQMAHTLVHEIAHNRGLEHKHMDCSREESEVVWARDLKLPLRKPAAKPTPTERVAARAENIDDRLAHWRRKLALAKTKVRKYEQAQKRTGFRLAALRAPPTPTP